MNWPFVIPDGIKETKIVLIFLSSWKVKSVREAGKFACWWVREEEEEEKGEEEEEEKEEEEEEEKEEKEEENEDDDDKMSQKNSCLCVTRSAAHYAPSVKSSAGSELCKRKSKAYFPAIPGLPVRALASDTKRCWTQNRWQQGQKNMENRKKREKEKERGKMQKRREEREREI